MLSIRNGPSWEWWVSGKTFERLFVSALDNGEIASDLERWMHAADANGGFNLTRVTDSDRERLVEGLRNAALRELAAGDSRDANDDDSVYRSQLRDLVAGSTIAIKALNAASRHGR